MAALMTRLAMPVDVAVLEKDWERPGFDLAKDGWVIRDDELLAYAVVYPDGFGEMAADDDRSREQLLAVAEGRARERGEPSIRFICDSSDQTLRFLRARGYTDTARYDSYLADLTVPLVSPGGWPILVASDRESEKHIHRLVRDSYGDDPDFERWRSWITAFTRDPELWLLTPDDRAPRAALVAWTFPDKGWIKRVALAPGAPLDAALALLVEAVKVLAKRGLTDIGLPVADTDPRYLHDLAKAASMRAGADSKVIVTKTLD